MEIQLQELIDQIKKDGVDRAEKEAAKMIEDADKEAKRIVANAKKEKERILTEAKNENERIVKTSEDAIRQAGRNLLISFRESVAREIKGIIGENVTAAFNSDKFVSLIVSAVENWIKNPDADDITVILNSADLKILEENLISAFKEKAISGVTLKPNDYFDGGFRIALSGGVYYDYSAESVVDMLSNYLAPKVTALLKEAE